MTTIIRVKRRRGEDPVEALVLSGKRKKIEEDESNKDPNLFKYILNFSGTVEEKDDRVAASTVESYKRESQYSTLKNRQSDIRSRQRRERKERSDESRFTLLSCLRSSNAFESPDRDSGDDFQKNVTIVDVTRDKEEGAEANNPSGDGSYVYDLYATNVESESDYNDFYMEHLLSVHPLDNQLDYRNGEDDYSDEAIDPDEDDSNDENNWRNDYPDSDIFEEDENGDEDQDEDGERLARQLSGFRLDKDEYESSSDSVDERYMNEDDGEQYCYYEAEDLAGRRYARYKANLMKLLIRAEDEGDEDDEDSDQEYEDCKESF